MRFFFSALISLFLLINVDAKQVVFPQISSVIDELHNRYRVIASTNERTLHFAKKPAGWVLQWKDLTKVPESVIEEELFWSAEKEKYLPLKTLVAGKTVKSEEEKYKLFSYSDRYSFSRIPYFGYAGWDRDVMQEFGGKKVLSDTLLEGLSRAYSNYAYDFTPHHYEYHTPADDLDDKTKLDSFIYYSRLDIATLDKLRKQNPEYGLLAGNASNKYAGSVVGFFDFLQFSGNENIAAPYFKEELFTPVILANAKTALAECAPDAILFTNGDNDTYPLEYLQFAKGFRIDVTIINLSLLNLYEIIEQASRGKGKAKPVKFSWPLVRYASFASDYFTMEGGQKPGMTYDKFLSECLLQEVAGKSYGDYYNCPECAIEFSATPAFFPEFINPSQVITPRIRINKPYLLRSDFAQLDILMSNLNERPIYYMMSTSDEGLNIEKYLFCEGTIKRFIPFTAREENIQSVFGQNVLPGICYDNLMKIEQQAFPLVDKITDDRFVTNFRIQFLMLANMIVEDDPAKAVKLLDRCDSLFPAATWKYEPAWAYGIQTYYDAGQTGKADRIALQMLDDFEKALLNKKPGPDEQNTFAAAQMIKQNAEKYNRSAVLEKANKYLEKNPG